MGSAPGLPLSDLADPMPPAALEPSDDALLPRLRLGEEAAFRILVRRHHARLVGVARGARLRPDAAEEAVQEAWIAVMRNIAGFEPRSSLRTWLTGIVLNIARKASIQARRTAPFNELGRPEPDGAESVFASDAFLADGHWREAPWHWSEIDLERRLAGRQGWHAVEVAIADLSPDEAAVFRLRDVEGFGPGEAGDLLGLGEARQRALLDRARQKIRRVFETMTRDTVRGLGTLSTGRTGCGVGKRRGRRADSSTRRCPDGCDGGSASISRSAGTAVVSWNRSHTLGTPSVGFLLRPLIPPARTQSWRRCGPPRDEAPSAAGAD